MVKEHDFVELEYTGKLNDGTVFDTTSVDVAKEHQLGDAKPVKICIGERMVLEGLDEALPGKEIGKEFTITIPPEKAFGKRDIKNMRIVPAATFKEHKVDPQPGLQVNFDGQIGVITRVSGGRIIVNFNHPLAGREVTYNCTIKEQITDKVEQIKLFLHSTMNFAEDKINVEIKEDVAEIKLPSVLPPPLPDMLKQKLVQLIKVKDVIFSK